MYGNKLQRKTKDSYININITIDNPPDYYNNKLTKKQYKKFYKFNFPKQYRHLLVSFMELDLLGKLPKLKIMVIKK